MDKLIPVNEIEYIGIYGRILLKLNNFFIVRRLVKRFICQYYKIPLATSISEDFYCSNRNLVVGKNVTLGDTYIRGAGGVHIGENTSLSYKNVIITTSHSFTDWSIIISKPVIIGSNVWITTNVTILPGVTIGDNSVIGAGSVVTKDIPSGVFAAGNPCKVIKPIAFKK